MRHLTTGLLLLLISGTCSLSALAGEAVCATAPDDPAEIRKSCAYRQAMGQKKHRLSAEQIADALVRYDAGEKLPEPMAGWGPAIQLFASVPKGSPLRNQLHRNLARAALDHRRKFGCVFGETPSPRSFGMDEAYLEFADVDSREAFRRRDDLRKKDSEGLRLKIEDAKNRLKNRIELAYGDAARRVETFGSCGEIQAGDGVTSTVKILYPPCGSNLTGYFTDNSIEPTTTEVKKDYDFDKCLADRKKNRLEIDRVVIRASSSRLNNTGEAARRYCRHGFLELSRDRALQAKEKLVRGIFPDEYQALLGQVEIDAGGENGDGTSGLECPYVLRDGPKGFIESLKPEFAPGGSKRRSLDQYKYIGVNVTFRSREVGVEDRGRRFVVSSRCQNLGFACNPDPAP